jgi:hypothetical protein
MDTLAIYRQVVQNLLKTYYNLNSASNQEKSVNEYLIFDVERDQYLWLRSGWDGKNGCNISFFICVSKMEKFG